MANTQFYVPAGTGRAYWGAGDKYTFLITGEESDGSYFTMEALDSKYGLETLLADDPRLQR